MNRSSRWTASAHVFLAALLIGAASLAAAQVQRSFPANALRGTIVIGQAPELSLNGAPARLAPAARIRGQNNMTEMSGALSGQRLVVNYTLDGSGELRDVWILRPEEAAVRPWPTTVEQLRTWSFDVATQTWTRP